MHKFKKGYLAGSALVVLSSFFYASYGIWTTLMGDFFGGYTASAIRSVFVLLILLPFAFIRKEFGSFSLSKTWKRLIAMVFVSMLIWGLLYYSVLAAGIGLSFTINYAAIIIGMLFFGWLFAGETLTTEKKWSALIGISGLILVFTSSISGELSMLPLIAALVSGLAVAANTVIVRELPYNTTQSTIALWGTSVLANFPMMFIINEPIPKFGFFAEWLYLVAFAVVSVLASWLLLKGMEYVDAGTAGILGILEIVFGILFGIILFSETIEPIAFVGVAVILIAAALPYLKLVKNHD